MKKKNGFISISIIYSFFIVFLLIMLAMLASYMNKRYLKKKIDNGLPTEAACRSGDLLRVCLENNAKLKQGEITSLSQEEISNGVNSDEEVGLFMAPDDYTRATGKQSEYYRGNVDDNYVKFGDYIWRIVRINGDNTYRLIYQGEYDSSAKKEESKVKNNDYIVRKETKSDGSIVELQTSKYNLASVDDANCNRIIAINNIIDDIRQRTEKESGIDFKSCYSSCESKSLWNKPICKINCLSGVPGAMTDNLKKGINSLIKVLDDNYTEQEIEKCYTSAETKGAHLLHNIGYMNNKTALLYRYDSKYDNQDDSDLKKFIDKWYESSNLDSSMLSQSTIFCGDKSRTKCACTNKNGCTIGDTSYKFGDVFNNCTLTEDEDEQSFIKKISNSVNEGWDKAEKYYYLGWERIVSNNNLATLICPDTGVIATKNSNKVLNLSRYNVTNEKKYINDTTKINKNLRIYYENGRFYNLSPSTKTYDKNKNMVEYSYEKFPYNYAKVNTGMGYYNYYTKVSLIKDYYAYNASLEYLGNGDLTYPIALLSADEAVFAGLTYGYDSKSYLVDHTKDNERFWTMTLSHSDYTDINDNTGAYYFAIKSNNEGKGIIVELNDKPDARLIEKINNSYEYSKYGAYVRPVINLVYSTVRCSGSGTASDPYIVGKNQYDASGNFIRNTCNE